MSMRRIAIAALIATLALLSLNLRSTPAMDTVILKGNHPREAATLASVGAADPNQQLSMEISLAVRNKAELDRLLADQQNPSSPHFRQWLAPGEYNRRFGPLPGRCRCGFRMASQRGLYRPARLQWHAEILRHGGAG